MAAFPRDLASNDLWLRSLQRSQRRRVEAVKGRKQTARRKGGSVAMSAAMLAGPTGEVLTNIVGTQPGSKPNRLRSIPTGGDILLRIGSRGEAVAAIQRLLGVEADGLFGPITRAAVREFQERHDLPRTGRVDERTWSAMLRFEAEMLRRARASVAAGNPNAVASRYGLTGAVEADGPTVVLAIDTSDARRPRVAAKVASSRDERRARAAARAARAGGSSSGTAPANFVSTRPPGEDVVRIRAAEERSDSTGADDRDSGSSDDSDRSGGDSGSSDRRGSESFDPGSDSDPGEDRDRDRSGDGRDDSNDAPGAPQADGPSSQAPPADGEANDPAPEAGQSAPAPSDSEDASPEGEETPAPPAGETPEPPTNETPEPPVDETPEPSTDETPPTDATPPTDETPKPPTDETPKPPVDETPKPPVETPPVPPTGETPPATTPPAPPVVTPEDRREAARERAEERREEAERARAKAQRQSCGSGDLRRPIGGPQTSGFGQRWGRQHAGLDLAAPTGTKVGAAQCGVVTTRSYVGGYGNMVCVRHTPSFATCYAHLSRFGPKLGAFVKVGQTVGYVGSTGNSTGPHLHFETRINGGARNPRNFLGRSNYPGQLVAAPFEGAGKRSSRLIRAYALGVGSKGWTSFSHSSDGYATGSTRYSSDPVAAASVAQPAPVSTSGYSAGTGVTSTYSAPAATPSATTSGTTSGTTSYGAGSSSTYSAPSGNGTSAGSGTTGGSTWSASSSSGSPSGSTASSGATYSSSAGSGASGSTAATTGTSGSTGSSGTAGSAGSTAGTGSSGGSGTGSTGSSGSTGSTGSTGSSTYTAGSAGSTTYGSTSSGSTTATSTPTTGTNGSTGSTASTTAGSAATGQTTTTTESAGEVPEKSTIPDETDTSTATDEDETP